MPEIKITFENSLAAQKLIKMHTLKISIMSEDEMLTLGSVHGSYITNTPCDLTIYVEFKKNSKL